MVTSVLCFETIKRSVDCVFRVGSKAGLLAAAACRQQQAAARCPAMVLDGCVLGTNKVCSSSYTCKALLL